MLLRQLFRTRLNSYDHWGTAPLSLGHCPSLSPFQGNPTLWLEFLKHILLSFSTHGLPLYSSLLTSWEEEKIRKIADIIHFLYCPDYSACIASVSPPSKAKRFTLCLSPLCKWQNSGTTKLNNLPKVTPVVEVGLNLRPAS